MPCPFSGRSIDLRQISRRDLLKQSLALGGMSLLSACLKSRGMPNVPRGFSEREQLPDRQYAWNEYLSRDSHGNIIFPYHQLILFFDYQGDGTPNDAERDQVERALWSLERAYQRGNGNNSPYRPGGKNSPGVLYTLGYSPSYFARYDDPLPQSVNLPAAEQTVAEINEPADNADEYDAAMVLVSDHAQVLLAVELALFGELERINGVGMEGTFRGIFEKRERRTGFIGPGVPRRELDMDAIPEQSPLGMGFISGFSDNQASEQKVAIQDGPFADGTTQHISRLTLSLERWYDRSDAERTKLMFSPEHTREDVGEVGEFLAADSNLTRDMGESIDTDASEHGIVGHTQKLAAARDDSFEPLLLRRSEAISTDQEQPGFNFTSLQRSIDHFVQARKAMNKESLDISEDQNGILDYIDVDHRGNYLVPPRQLASLPPSDPR